MPSMFYSGLTLEVTGAGAERRERKIVALGRPVD
jgi:hypothetical protein